MNIYIQIRKLSQLLKFILTTTVITLFSISVTHAEQIKFSKTLVKDNYAFNYQWLDYENVPQQMTFSLPQRDIFDRYRDFGAYQSQLARDYVNNELKKYFRKNPFSGVMLSFEESGGFYNVNIKSRKQNLIDEVSARLIELEEQFNQEYLTDRYYHNFITYNQISAIKPDHTRIADESAIDLKVLKPIILEKTSIKNIRLVSNYVLGFIQNIPYSTLESRIDSSGVGFIPPLKLLWENQGDCDSKVTLTASLLRALMPRIRMVFIYTENHALIGIDAEPNGDDITIVHNAITYVLAEPTGPAVIALGQVAPETEQAIYNGHYVVETFHATNMSSSDDE